MQFPHLAEVKIGGIGYEAVVMKHDTANNDLYFIRVDHMDMIDRQRMKTILLKRDAARYPLWDLLDQTTLPNGVNALDYFDQYVQGITAEGQLFKPQMGRRGVMISDRNQHLTDKARATANEPVVAETVAPEKKTKKDV